MSEIAERKPSSEDLKITLLTPENSQQVIKVLKLHGDSIAQRRNAANRKIYSNPLCLLALAVLVGVILSQYDFVPNLGTVVLLIAGLVNAWLLAGSRPSQIFITLASKVSKSLVDDSAAVFVIYYKDSIIGALSIKNDPNKNDGHVNIPIWTVERRYRNVGLGSDLLDAGLQYIKSNLPDSKNVSVDLVSIDSNARNLLYTKGFKLVKKTSISKPLSFFGIENERYELVL